MALSSKTGFHALITKTFVLWLTTLSLVQADEVSLVSFSMQKESVQPLNQQSGSTPQLSKSQSLQIKSLYGTVRENNALIKSLIVHPALRRLRQIDNAGPGRYFRAMPGYSLFDHALGVYVLLKRFNRPLKEQIAGMLEPVSHSVFSHQGTLYLRPKNSQLPYYLAAHSGFLKHVGIEKNLNAFKLQAKDVMPTRSEFKALYKNPPFLSAIEIEMTLRLAYSYKLLSSNDIEAILKDLRFENGNWFFVSQKSAERLGRLSLYFAERYWGSHQNYVLNRWVAAAIKRAMELKLLSVNDIRFGTDKNVLNRLLKMNDRIIRQLMIQCRQPFRFYDVAKGEDFDEVYKPEFRGLNPLVRLGSDMVRLTSISPKFKKDFDALRLSFLDGIRIKYKKPNVKQRVSPNGGTSVFPGFGVDQSGYSSKPNKGSQ